MHFTGVSRSQFHFNIIHFPYFRSSLFQGSIIFPHCIALPLPHPSLVLFRHRLILVVSSVFTPKNPLLHSKYHTGNCLSIDALYSIFSNCNFFKVFSWSFSIFTIRAIYISAATSLVRCNLQANCYN